MNANTVASGKLAGVALALALGLASGVAPAQAHDGPPYPIFVDQSCGAFTLSVWADPDVGTGTFFIYLEARDGTEPPLVAGVRVCVRPRSGRLPEARHDAERRASPRDHYFAAVPFDREEAWSVRVVVVGPHGESEAATEVLVTPPRLGPWSAALYLFPFALLAGLWTYGVARHGLKRRGRGRGGAA